MSHDRRPISFRRLLSLQVGLLVLGPLLLAAAAAWALTGTRSDYGSAAAGYRELTRAYEIGARLQSARTLALASQPDPARRELEAATRRLAAMTGDFGPDADERRWRTLDSHVSQAARTASPAAIDASIRDLLALSEGIQQRISDVESASASRQRNTIAALATGAVLLAVLCALVGWLQYRTIARPVLTLRRATSALAARDMTSRAVSAGPAELRDLAADFNRMADELQTLYQDLEAKVETRTRQLVSSARLASVGYLATGVAHEINNPLSIITGFAERALRTPNLDPKTADALTVVCEEAFRCKEITSKLLALARPTNPADATSSTPRPREPVPLADLARSVIAHVSDLPLSKDRVITVTDEHPPVQTQGHPNELRQVVLNLLINALEATAPHDAITLTLSRHNDRALLTLTDTGQGIPPDVLPHIFEPFYTKRTTPRPGIGLGLSLTQAILESHHGTITATSEGEGKGATFTIDLPLAP